MIREEIPTTLSKWEELAVRFDQNRADNALENDRRRGIGRSLYPDDLFRGKDPKETRTTEYRNPMRCTIRAMEIDEWDARAGVINQGRLTDQEHDRRRREGLCFRCGNKGHMSRECSQGGYAPQGARRWGNPPPSGQVAIKGIEGKTYPEDHPLVQISRLFASIPADERRAISIIQASAEDF